MPATSAGMTIQLTRAADTLDIDEITLELAATAHSSGRLPRP
jgi:hypothetical protein